MKILILDDDADFNTLLTDVFTHADYEVISSHDPKQALDIVKEEPVDLIVTDQRMPHLSGLEFFREIRSIHENMPIIMVSGFLEHDTIRELINNGVNGIFLKPLNIFSLLKRTAELLGNSVNGEKELVTETSGPKFNNSLGFKFRSYPCRAVKSAAFAKKLFAIRNFKSNLMIIGEKGVPFKEICEDICGFAEGLKEELIYLCDDNFEDSKLIETIKIKEAERVERITVAVMDIEHLDSYKTEIILKIANREKPFHDLKAHIRFVYSLRQDIDALYDQGLIDENLYIFLGTTEVHVPPLRQCREDIAILTEQIIYNVVKEKGYEVVLIIEPKGLDYLENLNWDENNLELKQTIKAAIRYSQGATISYDDLHLAHELNGEEPRVIFQQLESHLRDARDEYLQAVLHLCGGNVNKTARVLGLRIEKIEALINCLHN